MILKASPPKVEEEDETGNDDDPYKDPSFGAFTLLHIISPRSSLTQMLKYRTLGRSTSKTLQLRIFEKLGAIEHFTLWQVSVLPKKRMKPSLNGVAARFFQHSRAVSILFFLQLPV
jgi:hypothetical protein